MSTNGQEARTRLRSASVALALLGGIGATLATSPARVDCPRPPADGLVSDFYGPQEHDLGMARLAVPGAFSVSGFDVVGATVSAPSCLTSDDDVVPVRINLELDIDELGPVPEGTLRTLTVTDGLGRSWSPEEVSTRERLPPSSDGGEPYESFANVLFQLPIDLVAPVSLHLGDLGDATLDELSLDEARPSGRAA